MTTIQAGEPRLKRKEQGFFWIIGKASEGESDCAQEEMMMNV